MDLKIIDQFRIENHLPDSVEVTERTAANMLFIFQSNLREDRNLFELNHLDFVDEEEADQIVAVLGSTGWGLLLHQVRRSTQFYVATVKV